VTVDSNVLEAARAHYLVAALEGRSETASAILDTVLLKGVSTADVVAGVLAPAQAEIGSLWQGGTISIAEEHVASAITAACLHLPRLMQAAPPPDRGRVLMVSAEGEWHTLPAEMVALTWQALGWDIRLISPSVPAADLGQEATRDAGAVAGVSCSSAAHLTGAWRTVSALRAAGMRVIVGGRLFDGSSELAERIGADAYCADPMDASSWLEDAQRSGKVPREPLLREDWEGLEPVWQALPRVVEDSLRLAPHLAELALPPEQTREQLWLMARTCVGATLLDDPALLADHMVWCRQVLAGHGADEGFADVLVATIDRVLPEGSARVRSLLAAAV
jgi:methanogenic corrinoid protein MtbC1